MEDVKRYDYKTASDLWNEYINTVYWIMDFVSNDEKQKERRAFMRCITRKSDVDTYINFLENEIIESRPVGVHGCYDFEYERAIESLIKKLQCFL